MILWDGQTRTERQAAAERAHRWVVGAYVAVLAAVLTIVLLTALGVIAP
jgi:hypothetical protein